MGGFREVGSISPPSVRTGHFPSRPVPAGGAGSREGVRVDMSRSVPMKGYGRFLGMPVGSENPGSIDQMPPGFSQKRDKKMKRRVKISCLRPYYSTGLNKFQGVVY